MTSTWLSSSRTSAISLSSSVPRRLTLPQDRQRLILVAHVRTIWALFLCVFLIGYGPCELAQAGENPSSSATSAHWSFRPIIRPDLPKVRNPDWVRNGIDHFILARLEQEGIKPSPEADRITLIRRLSFDLIGLPPTLAEVNEFLNDPDADVYSRMVDRLLASPHFGERWGRHWLDLARYADSDGYEKDSPRPYAYLYRDWVIQAINRDLPFDRFSLEQLAGDLLPEASEEQRIATGFHRNTLTNKEGGVDQEEFRCKATVDRTSTTGTIWLGLTIGCAECHNHKYDPISQRDFYQLYAFFNDASEKDLPLPTPAELAQYETEKSAWDAKAAELKTELDEYLGSDLSKNQERWEQSLCDEDLWLMPRAVLDALLQFPDQRSDAARKNLADFYRKQVDSRARQLDRTLADHKKREPKFPPRKAQILVADSRKTQIHIRGDFLRKGDEVEPGFPEVLKPVAFAGQPNPARRLHRGDLADWIFGPGNPLTARVSVNRVWFHLFGRGLVATLDDFGVRGERPSHPELLDWLASEYPRQGWRLKSMIKLIVTSSTYRQASNPRPDLAERDPNNTLFARQNRIRLEAETVRDAFLTASGLLAKTMGGPSVRPPLPADIAALGYANSVRWAQDEGEGRYRRGLYIFFQRTVPYPMLMTFDAPDSNVTCTRRERSNTPLQALTLLNDPVFFECAQALGRRIAMFDTTQHPEKIRFAFRACLGRLPTDAEIARLEQLYNDQLRLLEPNPDRSAQIAGGLLSDPHLAQKAAWILVARAILNLDEFITRE